MKTQQIKEKHITTVKDWNRDKRLQKQFISVYTLGNGSMLDVQRKKGYVVQKRHIQGGERSKFHLSLNKAMRDYNSNKF